MYKQINDTKLDGAVIGPAQCIKRLADNAFIPFDPASSDYQAYLKWLEEGNAPLGADEPLPADIPPEPASPPASELRKQAYREEADPLFFKVQRGEATEQEWLDKIEEIKARYPKE